MLANCPKNGWTAALVGISHIQYFEEGRFLKDKISYEPCQEKDIGDPDIIVANIQIANDCWERSRHDCVLEGTQKACNAERGYDGPKSNTAGNSNGFAGFLDPLNLLLL